MKHFSKFLALALVLLPSVALAQSTVDTLITAAFGWLSALVYIVIGIAMILFFWGIIKYVIAGSANEEGRRDGRNLIVYGIVGLFVMVAIWGLVYFVGGLLGIGIGGTTAVPALPTPGTLPTGTDSTLVTIIKTIGGWIAQLAVLMIAFALVAFLWGVTKYIASGADEEKRTNARNLIVYGVIGLFAMVAVWGLVYFIGNTIGVQPGSSLTTVPQVDNISILNQNGSNPAVSITGTAMTSCSTTWNPSSNSVSFMAFVCLILTILNPIPPILLGLAVLYFFWGIANIYELRR